MDIQVFNALLHGKRSRFLQFGLAYIEIYYFSFTKLKMHHC